MTTERKDVLSPGWEDAKAFLMSEIERLAPKTKHMFQIGFLGHVNNSIMQQSRCKVYYPWCKIPLIIGVVTDNHKKEQKHALTADGDKSTVSLHIHIKESAPGLLSVFTDTFDYNVDMREVCEKRIYIIDALGKMFKNESKFEALEMLVGLPSIYINNAGKWEYSFLIGVVYSGEVLLEIEILYRENCLFLYNQGSSDIALDMRTDKSIILEHIADQLLREKKSVRCRGH